jgi:hypothetical protein
MRGAPLSGAEIKRLFAQLNEQLASDGVQGEIYLVGGAVMCLVHEARESTRDVDAFFRPANELRTAAAKVALQNDLPEDWLNDAVKRFLSEHGSFNLYLQLSHVALYAADPSYLLAMKCLSARIGEEFHDIDDLRYLLRHLNLTRAADARAVIERYYPLEKFPQKTLYLLEDLLPVDG